MNFIRNNTVMCIAFFAAFLSCLVVPPDIEYLGYFDLKTLTCLFCTLAVICAFKNIHFFRIVATKIVSVFKTVRTAVIALIYITFIGSMIIANDMALITFLPLGYYVITSTNNHKYLAFTFIMQNIAANLGGMLTPFGNPQNLYLYSYFDIPNGEFVKIMFLPFIISITLITACCMFVKNDKLEIKKAFNKRLNKKLTVIYSILFIYSIAIVFNVIPYWTGLIIIPLSLLFLDKRALLQVDYPLLLTFCAFFVFSGNASRIPIIQDVVGDLVNKHTMLFGVLSCQLISNVPSAILLSHFTQNYPALLIAVNIGGAGTVIASLASLITLREYTKNEPAKIGSYMKKFSIYNFGILAVLICVMGFIYGF